MSKSNELKKTTSLLTQALGTALASMPNNRAVAEAAGDIRRAIRKIDGVAQEQVSKRKMSQTQFETWWGNIQSGTSNMAAEAHQGMANMSAEAHQKSLAQLNAMIAKEESKLGELDSKAADITANAASETTDQLLQD